MEYKLRGVEIIGIEKTCEPELVFGFLQRIRAQFGMPLPKKIIFRKMYNYGRGHEGGDYMTINYEISFTEMLFTILHELVHNQGLHGHNKKFWRRYLTYCKLFNLDPKESFHYASGKRYYENRLSRTLEAARR